MTTLFDYFGNPEVPALSLCYLNNTLISPIPDPEGVDFSCEFLNPNEISFRVYEYRQREGEKEKWQYYDLVDVYRQVFVEGSGYYVITDCSETQDVENPYKDISASSCEVALGFKNLSLSDGTYKFANAENLADPETIMGKVLEKIPLWNLKSIDSELFEKTRFLDAFEGNVYDFLRNTLEDRYSCIFEFDPMEHTISVMSQDRTIDDVGILLSYDNFIRDISVDRKNDQIYTALRAIGGDGISIESVNPIGGGIIYQFDYFQDDMPTGLWTAIEAWNQKIANNQSAFSNAVLQVQKINADILKMQQDKIVLESQKTTYEQIIELRKESGLDYADVQQSLEETIAKIEDVTTQIMALEQELQTYQSQAQTIQADLAFANNFTSEQILQLDPFIIYGEFRDDNIVTTDNMTYEDKQKQSQELYERCVQALKDTLIDKGSFEINSQNFLFDYAFKPYADKLKVGSKIRVEDRYGNYVPYLLVGYDFSYDDGDLTLSFNNLGTNDNSLDTYAKLYGELSKATSVIQDSLSSKVNETTIDQLYDEIQDIKGQAEAILTAEELTVKRIITGYISVQNAKTPGQTIIDGGNITTGTINAELVKIINLVVDHLLSHGSNYSLESKDGQVYLYHGDYSRMRLALYFLEGDEFNYNNTFGNLQIWKGKVNKDGVLLDNNARYAYLTAESMSIGENKKGTPHFQVWDNGSVDMAGDFKIVNKSTNNPSFYVWNDGDISFNGARLNGISNWWIANKNKNPQIWMDNGENSNAIEFVYESTGDKRTILRGVVQGTCYLGVSSLRWNVLYCYSVDQASDRKLKTDVASIDNATAFLMSLEPVKYRMKDGKRIHYGFIAQDVAKAAADNEMGDLSMYKAAVVGGEEEQYFSPDVPDEQLSWGLDYSQIIPLLVNVVQQQQRDIESLKREVAELKGGSI